MEHGKRTDGAVDPAVLRQLADQHWPRLYQVAYMMLHEHAAAEDTAQETIARAIEHLDQFRGENDLLPWCLSIAINLCREKMRADRSAPVRIDGAAIERIPRPSARRGPFTSATFREAYQRAASAVAGLSATLREVFVLHYIEGMPYDQVARVCGITEGAAKLRGMRARQSLRQELAEMLAPEVRRRLDAEPVEPPPE